MSHELDGKDPNERIRAAGYKGRRTGENIAAEVPDARAAMKLWMNSPPHRKNILSPEFNAIGVGVSPSKKGDLYFCQCFGG